MPEVPLAYGNPGVGFWPEMSFRLEKGGEWMEGFRSFLAQLESSGEVFRHTGQVSTKYEAAAIIADIDHKTGKVTFLENLEGYKSPVAANIFGRRERIAKLFGTTEITDYCLEKVRNPIAVEFQRQGQCQENVYCEELDIQSLLPVLTHYEGDSGPYLTVGMLIAKSPDGRNWSMGIHRLQVKGKNRLGVLLASPPISNFLKEAESKGLPLEVAIAIGVDPILLLSSVIWAPEGLNKAEVAGGLAGRPMIFTKGLTVDVPVPADAEFILEGRIIPGLREPEGPFGEETGVYAASLSPVIEITAITSRRSPIYQALVPFTSEGRMLLTVAFEIAYNKKVQEVFPLVKTLRVSPLDWTSLIVQLKREGQQQAKNIINYLFRESIYIKSVVVVDEDVNPADPADVMWALSTRCQPDEDVVIGDGFPGSPIDPSLKNDGTTSKIGYDATVPRGNEKAYRKVQFPKTVRNKLSLP
ncbi:MAG: UbiD family decarboxylase [Bacillota bacterium]